MDSTISTYLQIKQKKKKRFFHNEKTVLVVKDIPEEMYRTQLWTHSNPHKFLQQFNVKSYKTITTAKGEKFVIGYFEK
jgi:hypothetical protein